MEKLKNLFKDIFYDYLKNYINVILLPILVASASLLTDFKSIKITLTFPLWLSLFILSIILVCFSMLIVKNRRLQNELEEYSIDDNVKNFAVGDTVIQKLKSDNPLPPKLIVIDVKKNKVLCRDSNDREVEFTPQELMTSIESEVIFNRIQNNKDDIERANKEFIDSLTNYY